MSGSAHLAALGIGICGVFLSAAGINLLRLFMQERRGKEPSDNVSYTAIARYPVADFGEHWKKGGHPGVVAAVGGFLLFSGAAQIIAFACYVGHYFLGMDLGFPK
ncbi:MAG: hypothetical protein KBC05_16385 [Candidatus Hydrogenedentes bacterium]|nr:hypothetical protein [Candidatus Hydrogenedentota bacterium]